MRRSFLTILVLFLVNGDLFAQESKSVFTTRQLAVIAEQFGPDSCLKHMRMSVPINLIDSSLATLLTSEYVHGRSYLQFYHFVAVGQSMKNDVITDKTISIVKAYSSSFHDIDEEYLFVLLFQGDSTLVPMLHDLFKVWQYRADSVRRHYPSNLTRFFHRFKGLPRYEELHGTCRRNAYKLALTINKLAPSTMPFEKVEAIRKQILPAQMPLEMRSSNGSYHAFRADTIQLSKHYNAIDEIDLDHEPAFIKHKEDLVGPMCGTTVITNHNLALYDIGCLWAPLAGRGKTMKLALVEGNKLIISLIQGWIS